MKIRNATGFTIGWFLLGGGALDCAASDSGTPSNQSSDDASSEMSFDAAGPGSDAARDADACVLTTCAAHEAQCGSVSNGCGATLDCGTCPAPDACGSAHACVCTPATCASLGATCGTLPDACGGSLSCGTCTAPQTCGGGGANVCGSGTCTPSTCSEVHDNCGGISDGCGNTLDCGSCASPQVCGGGGTANVCGCTPTTCIDQGATCGSITDGCGNTLACGACPAAQVCGGGGVPNVCGAPTSSDAGNDGPPQVGQVDGGFDGGLPALPTLTNVIATEHDDWVGIDFEPFDDAVDYRVYPLPNAQNITANADGSVTIANAIYRCAGTRQTYDLANNLNSNWLSVPDDTEHFTDPTKIAGQYSATATISSTPAGDTLGYVYLAPATGLVPVYAVGVKADNFEHAWRASRTKTYTTDPTERLNLLTSGARDDGIAFYVPAAAGSSTTPIYSSADPGYGTSNKVCDYQYYFGAAKESSHQGDPTPPVQVFSAFTSQAAGSVPLLSVEIGRNGGECHTELAAGLERYKQAASQGRSAVWHLEWSGLSQPTTLVVEALKSGCPFQGLLSPQSLPSIAGQGPGVAGSGDSTGTHQQFFSLADLQSRSATGEVFVNGQYDTSANPPVLARSYVDVAPYPHDPTQWDWYQGFANGTSFGTGTSMTCQPTPCTHVQTASFDLFGSSLDDSNAGTNVFTYGQILGQFWLEFADWAQDVTAPVRLSALQQASMSSDPNSYLHVMMSVDIVTTGRRYPQIIISDQAISTSNSTYEPILTGNYTGATNPNNWLIIQPISDGWDVHSYISLQAFHGTNGRSWAINNQYPADHLTLSEGDGPPPTPYEPIMEHTGLDRLAAFDVYLSSARLYVFMDGTPIACRQWPASVPLQGPVTVTFGDTMYHEGADPDVADSPTPMPFVLEHLPTETKRHFDDLAFKSGVAAPAWDTVRFPCPPAAFNNSD